MLSTNVSLYRYIISGYTYILSGRLLYHAVIIFSPDKWDNKFSVPLLLLIFLYWAGNNFFIKNNFLKDEKSSSWWTFNKRSRRMLLRTIAGTSPEQWEPRNASFCCSDTSRAGQLRLLQPHELLSSCLWDLNDNEPWL